MIKIRPYYATDWGMVEAWWKASGEVPPLPTMMPLESSFVAEVSSRPALAVALYLTNTLEIAYVENFVGNPELKGEARKRAATQLVEHFMSFAKQRGYRRLMCMTEKPALMTRYQELGFHPTLGGVTAFVRET